MTPGSVADHWKIMSKYIQKLICRRFLFVYLIFCCKCTVWQKSAKILRKGRKALSSGDAWSFLLLFAVVLFSSSFATQRCRKVHSIPDATGYLIFATKQICRKLHTACSKLSSSDMKTSPSRIRSKTTFLKHKKKYCILLVIVSRTQCCGSGMCISGFRIMTFINPGSQIPDTKPTSKVWDWKRICFYTFFVKINSQKSRMLSFIWKKCADFLIISTGF